MVQPITSILRVTAVASIAALAGALACSSDTTGVSATSASQLSFTTAAGTAASASMVPITNGGHTLDLTGVQLTIARAELKRTQSDACPGDDDQDDDHPRSTPSTEECGEMKI